MTRFAPAFTLLALTVLLGCEKQSTPPQNSATQSDTAPTQAQNSEPASPATATHKASGKIEAVDPVAGTLKINHGPVATLNWPAMTMDFTVSDKALLNNLKSGQQIEFDFTERGSDYVVTAIR